MSSANGLSWPDSAARTRVSWTSSSTHCQALSSLVASAAARMSHTRVRQGGWSVFGFSRHRGHRYLNTNSFVEACQCGCRHDTEMNSFGAFRVMAFDHGSAVIIHSNVPIVDACTLLEGHLVIFVPITIELQLLWPLTEVIDDILHIRPCSHHSRNGRSSPWSAKVFV